MISEEFDVITLEPVRCEQAEITVIKNRKERKERHKHRAVWKSSETGKGSIIDMLIRQCLVCLLVFAMFAAVNFIGLNSFIENLKHVVEYQSISDYFTSVLFV